MNSKPIKIDKKFALNIIAKAMRGEKVGNGTGCRIAFEFYDGYNQSRYIQIYNEGDMIPEINLPKAADISFDWYCTQGGNQQRLINGSSRSAWYSMPRCKEHIDNMLKEIKNTGRYNCTVTWHN